MSTVAVPALGGGGAGRRARRPLAARARDAMALELRPLVRIGDDHLARTLLIGLGLAQLLDVFTTAALLGNGRVEANPLSAMLISQLGLPGLLMMKSILTLGVAAYAGSAALGMTRLMLATAAVASFAAVAWNVVAGAAAPI